MHRSRILLLAALASHGGGCGATAPTASPTRFELPTTLAAVRPAAGSDEIAGAPFGYDTKLLFGDDGGLLVAADNRLALVDTRRRELVDQLFLDSPRVPDRSNELAPNAWLQQTSHDAIWAWDAAQHTLVGATCLAGIGTVASGLAVWTPSALASPTPIAHAPSTPCAPLAISRDATRVLARVGATTVAWFAIADGAPLGVPIELGHTARLAAVSPDGTRIAFAADHGELGLYDTRTGALRTLARTHDHRIRALGFAPAGRVVLATGDVGAFAWELDDATDHTVPVADYADAFAFSADGALLALASAKQIAIVDGTTFVTRTTIPIAGAMAVAWTPDRARLVASTRRALVVHDASAAPASTAAPLDRAWFDQLHPLPVPPAPREPPFASDGSIDGRVVARGMPLAGVEVRLTSGERWPIASKLAPIVEHTGGDGAFHFRGVPRVNWLLAVAPTGMTASSGGVSLRDRPTATRDVTVEPAVTIHGVVLGPDGQPAVGARVVHDATYGLARVETTTGPDGSFIIDHLDRRNSTGRYDLAAWGADGAIGLGFANLYDAAGPKATIQLARATDPNVLRVQFVDEHGAPIIGARVSFHANVTDGLTDAHGLASTWFDAARFSTLTHLHAAIAVDDGFEQGADIAVPAHDVQVITVRTSPPASAVVPPSCARYRELVAQIAGCERVPQATRDALAAELAWSEPRWRSHPERIGSACDLDERSAEDVAKPCRDAR